MNWLNIFLIWLALLSTVLVFFRGAAILNGGDDERQ